MAAPQASRIMTQVCAFPTDPAKSEPRVEALRRIPNLDAQAQCRIVGARADQLGEEPRADPASTMGREHGDRQLGRRVVDIPPTWALLPGQPVPGSSCLLDEREARRVVTEPRVA